MQKYYNPYTKDLPKSGYVFLGILSLITLVTVLIYFEEIHFLMHNFSITLRRKKTIWVLAFYPVNGVLFVVTGLTYNLYPSLS